VPKKGLAKDSKVGKGRSGFVYQVLPIPFAFFASFA
jgi:hypothetical protein